MLGDFPDIYQKFSVRVSFFEADTKRNGFAGQPRREGRF